MELEQPLYQPHPWHVKALAAVGITLLAAGICAAPYIRDAAIRSAVAPSTDATTPTAAANPPSLLPNPQSHDSLAITSWGNTRAPRPLPSPIYLRFFCDRPAHISPRL